MGQRRACEAPVIPDRPKQTICISNASGVGQCLDPVTGVVSPVNMQNHICTNISDYNKNEEWIDVLLRAIRQ